MIVFFPIVLPLRHYERKEEETEQPKIECREYKKDCRYFDKLKGYDCGYCRLANAFIEECLNCQVPEVLGDEEDKD